MDRVTWQGTVHGVTRVGYDLATKPPPKENECGVFFFFVVVVFLSGVALARCGEDFFY